MDDESSGITAAAARPPVCWAEKASVAIGPDHTVWDHDPVLRALEASKAGRNKLSREWMPESFCAEAGRTLLLAQLQFSSWVLRRVECVRFEGDRSVSRHITVEFNVRSDAPVFESSEGPEYLVPLSVMRRRTLVNFTIEDESHNRLPMLGMRLTQQLDQAMLLAAAAATTGSQTVPDRVQQFVQAAVAGTADRVDDEMARYFAHQVPGLDGPEKESLFAAALERLHRHFSLYVLLPVERGTHRVLSLSFEEPTDWRLQQPQLKDRAGGGKQYRAGLGVRRWQRGRQHLSAKLGITPTVIRFQIPSAENTASYHFEATAPPGVRIVEASLLAGRPNEPKRPVSIDRVIGHAPTVGLHAVEIPSGSLCRVQLALRVPTRGWLTQLVMSCAVIAAVLGSVVFHLSPIKPGLIQEQVTNVVVLLVTASAATATLVAQRDFHGVAASLVTHLRAVGVLSLSLPIAAAAWLVYEARTPTLDKTALGNLQPVFIILFGISVVLLGLAAQALRRSSLAERPANARASPWDMTVRPSPAGSADVGTAVVQRSKVPRDYDEALDQLGFDLPAVGIQSAEGWHEIYDWTDERQQEAEEQLELLGQRLRAPDSPSRCQGRSGACAVNPGCPLTVEPTPPGDAAPHQVTSMGADGSASTVPVGQPGVGPG